MKPLSCGESSRKCTGNEKGTGSGLEYLLFGLLPNSEVRRKVKIPDLIPFPEWLELPDYESNLEGIRHRWSALKKCLSKVHT
jgi:hypothetical protein